MVAGKRFPISRLVAKFLRSAVGGKSSGISFRELRVRCVFRLRWVYLTRFSWMCGLALWAIPFVGLVSLPGLLGNLFVLDGPVQLFNISWITMVIAAMVLVTYRISELNAPARFDDYRRAYREYLCVRGLTHEQLELRRRNWRLRWALLWLMWAPIPAACFWSTWLDPEFVWDRVDGAVPLDYRVGMVAASAIASGAAVGLMFLRLAAFIEQNLLAPNAVVKGLLPFAPELSVEDETAPERRGSVLTRGLAALIGMLGPGYSTEVAEDASRRVRGDEQIALGHSQQALFASLILAFYLGNYVLGLAFQIIPSEASPLSALYYALLSMLLAACVLPGLAFYFDRFRIPVFLVAVCSTFFLYMVCETDHFYELNPPLRTTGEARTFGYEAPRLEDVFDGWEFPEGRDGKRTLVVIDASGGGIQASAWTAQVLTGLDELYGTPFSRSVGIVSAVSGGSVGSMFYLIHRPEMHGRVSPETRRLFTPEAAAQVREAAAASALESTAWGIAYPDLIRTIFPPLTSRVVDRGWAIEQIWRQRMRTMGLRGQDHGDLRLSDLGIAARDNQLPLVAFNATIVETGQRLVVSPVITRSVRPQGTATALSEAQEFFSLYGPQAHIRVSTAVRLSATFPYVSPVCRPLPPDEETGTESTAEAALQWHVADGAYSDNEGVVTTVDWINRLLEYYSHDSRILRRPFDRVLLLRIQPFPTRAKAAGATNGWVNAAAGPLKTMLNVRVASQMERGNLEVRLLTKATTADAAVIKDRYADLQRAAEATASQFAGPGGNDAPAEGHLDDDDRTLAARAMVAGGANVRGLRDEARATAARARHKVRQMAEIDVRSVRFIFQPEEGAITPLSWKLTAGQKRSVTRAWNNLIADRSDENPLRELDNWFHRLPVAKE